MNVGFFSFVFISTSKRVSTGMAQQYRYEEENIPLVLAVLRDA